MNTVKILAAKIDRLSMTEAVEKIRQLLQTRQGGHVVTPNVDHLFILRQDPEFQEIYRHAKLVLADGMPVVWASRLLRKPLPERVAGSDLLPRLCQMCSEQGFKVFFLGGHPSTLQDTLAKLSALFPGLPLAGAYAPPFGFDQDLAEDQKALNAVLQARPDLLFVCLGAPKQEKFLWRHKDALAGVLGMGVGISLEFLTGKVKRAPLWMRRMGLEWLHRLAQEPRRLWRRYLKDALFPFLLVAQILREGRQS